MPKRGGRFYFEPPPGVLKQLPGPRRKSIVEKINDKPEEGNQSDVDFEEDLGEELTDAEFLASLRNKKPMRRMKYNQNNEIERLLLHNGSGLSYHVNHNEFPSFNVGLWPNDNQDQLLVYPTCAFSIPRPIYISDTIQEKIDLCYRRPMAREYHRNRLFQTRTAYNTALKNKKTRQEEKKNIYTSSVFDMAERVLTQPDPYFQSSYDYYYAGGNLCTLRKSGSVVHATGPNLKTIELQKFPMAEDYTVTSSLKSVAKITSPEKSEVFEIQPMLNPSTDNCFIARQRNLVSLNYLSDNNNIKILTQFRTKSTPFISFTQCDRDYTKFLLTTMKQHVRLYDIGGNVPRLAKLYEIESEALNVSWNTLKPWRENTFLYANEYKFCVIDVRTTPAQWMSSATSAIEHTHVCDHISAVKPSGFNNLFYVATNHRLHCLDIRHIRNSLFNHPDAAVCRWSHQMQYSPLMMDTWRLNNIEYIALSSPLAGDLHICQLSRKKNVENLSVPLSDRVPKHIYNSPCLPYQPPTLMEAYNYARMDGNCLQPESNLHGRLLACTTGLNFCRPSMEGSENGLGLLLTSNSLGDIFLQTLNKRENQESDSRGNSRSNEIMDDFAKTLLKRKQPLNYTDIKDMKAMRKIFLCNYLSRNENRNDSMDAMDESFSENDQPTTTAAPAKNKRKRLHLGRWQKSLATLHAYKDALVPDLLSIWDIEMEEDKGAVIHLSNLETSRHIKPDPDKKVENWLTTNLRSTAPMVVIPRISDTLGYGDTEPIIPEETNTSLNLNETQDSINFDNVIQSTQIVNETAMEALNVSTLNESTRTQMKETIVQQNTSAIEATQLNTTESAAADHTLNTTSNSLNKSKTKKKSKKYVKGF